MLKILHIASGDLWAGAEVQLYNLTTELFKHEDICVCVLLLNHGELESRLRQKGVSVQVIDEKVLGSFAVFNGIIKAIQDFRPAVVHTHRQKENILGSIAAKICGTKICVRTVHGLPEFRFRPWQIHKHAYRFFDQLCGQIFQQRIIAVSAPLAKALENTFPARKIVAIENGINTEELYTQADIDLPVPLAGKPNSTKICIICRLTPVKRLDIFLKIAERLMDSDPDGYDFYIFGNGPLETSLKERVSNSYYSHGIHMMGFQPNIPAYLSKMNILLITSDHEGLPMNLLEAMALKVYIVASAVGGIPSALWNGKGGMLIENQNIEKFISAIKTYKSNPRSLDDTITFSQKTVNNTYSARNCARQYLDSYTTIPS